MGTIGGQKAEMVANVENKGEYSLVSCAAVRGSKPFKDFTIRVDEDWLPYVSLGDDAETQTFEFNK